MSADIKLEKLQQELLIQHPDEFVVKVLKYDTQYSNKVATCNIYCTHHVQLKKKKIGFGCMSIKPYVYFPFHILPRIPVNVA